MWLLFARRGGGGRSMFTVTPGNTVAFASVISRVKVPMLFRQLVHGRGCAVRRSAVSASAGLPVSYIAADAEPPPFVNSVPRSELLCENNAFLCICSGPVL